MRGNERKPRCAFEPLSWRLRRTPFLRASTGLILLILLLQISGIFHFAASTVTGGAADCTSQYGTRPQSNHCLPLCPTCTCAHLGRSLASGAPAPMAAQAVLSGFSQIPLEETYRDTLQPEDFFRPPRS